MSFRKATIEEARASYKPLRRRQIARQAAPKKSVPVSPDKRIPAKPAPRVRKRRTLKAKPDSALAAWGRRVLDRDGLRCQWPKCRFCLNHVNGGGVFNLDPHHKALRSARPDLRLVDENGVTICRLRHDWVHSEQGRDEAIATGFLNLRTMELARREGTLGVI